MNLSVIVEGVEYSLSDDTLVRFISEAGLGMPSIKRFDERGPAQRGSTDRGFVYQPRYATYLFGIIAESDIEMADKREQLQELFRPTRDLIMKHELENGKIRYLDCVFHSGLDMPANDRDVNRWQKASLTVKADDPTFYDPEAVALTFALGGGVDLWTFPWEIPWGIGASEIDLTQNINYDGNIFTYPNLIRITGPATDPVIINEAIDRKLDFTGVTISGGDYYDIDLRYGFKSVIDKAGDDRFDDLTTDSDSADFRIVADDEVSGGVNQIRFTCSGVSSITKLEITYYNRYQAI